MKKIIAFFKNLLKKKKKNTKPEISGTKVIFLENFTELSLSTSTHIGTWRPNDNWQPIDKGYHDFAGKSYNVNPNQSGAKSPFIITDEGLEISCTKQQDGKWHGGILITDSHKTSFLYGYISARIKFPVIGNGMFPAFWLYSVSDDSVDYDHGGAELDIMEVCGDGTTVSATAHMLNDDQKGSSVEISSKKLDLEDVWHTYAVDWQPTHIKFYIDDIFVGEVPSKDVSFFNVPMSIRLNYSMDANWFPVKSDETTPNVLKMIVNEVKVQDRKE